ncbi:MAG TPA: hypothetical protein VEX68_00305 [Bryobacteraceae bacterium]|nr:hypothetical protein [Bryobacteraceae bacterium]
MSLYRFVQNLFLQRLKASVVTLVILVALTASGATTGRKFYTDDPLTREPETQDASIVQSWDIDLIYDLSYNVFVTPSRPQSNIKAQNVNTIDEAPDSSWFTNRMSQVTAENITRPFGSGQAPASEQWTVVHEKTTGFAPGFTARDAKGVTWFLSFDPPSNPEGATGALVIATKIFWALGYNQVETFLTSVNRENMDIDPSATTRRPSGKRTPLTSKDLDEVFDRAARNPDGTYRAAAGRLIPGRVLGGFRYLDTRPDDPNDIVPHQHRRELRALRVFGAWTNLTDMKAGNTLDTLVTEDGRGIVKHYLQDVGSTFGIGANGPHDWDEGWEYLYEGGATRRRLLSFGFWLSPWQTADYKEHPSIGRFEGKSFNPEEWKPRVPTAAYMEMRDDDAFWAARRVMAFSDEMIRAVVKAGAYSDPEAERHLADVLIERRNKIGRTYLTRVNPIIDPAIDTAGALTFGNAATQAGISAAPAEYRAAWFDFNNETGQTTPLGETRSKQERIPLPANLPSRPGAFLKVEVNIASAAGSPTLPPAHVYFRRSTGGWKLVGLERMP